jgi:cell division protease FtsH
VSTSTAAPEQFDELDRRIDTFLGQMGRLFRTLLIVGVIAGFVWIMVIPNWATWGSTILFGLYMMFQLFFAVMFMIVQFVALFWFLGRPRLYWVMPGETGVGFKDYKGNPEVLEAARQVVTLVKGVKGFQAMGGQPIRGLLLVGPPGTGKSYLGQAISTEAGVPFGYLSAPSIMGMFMGMDVMRVLFLYNKARKLAAKYGACILFIDEIDAIGKARTNAMPGMGFGGMMMGGGAGALNELLNQMDPLPRDGWKARMLRKLGLRTGRSKQYPVLTIAATNIAEVLDPALLRPGRFDRKIVVDHPDADGRREIIEYYLSKVKHDDLPLERMIGDTIGHTPVVIKHVINEAVVRAHWEGRESITYLDFQRAIEGHEWGLRQPIRSMSHEEKRRIAYHEAGHAVSAIKLWPSHLRVSKATIIRHGSALGLVGSKPLEERHTTTKEELLAQIQVSLASRAAEQIFLGIEMSGAHHDLQSATRVADFIVRQLGMNGSLFAPLAVGQMVPDAAAQRDIEKLLEQQFKQVKALLLDHTDAVIAVAESLLEREELQGDELMELVTDADKRSKRNGHAPRNGTNGTAARAGDRPAEPPMEVEARLYQPPQLPPSA